MSIAQRLGNDRTEPPKTRARSGLRVPLPVALAGLGVLAAGSPAQAYQAVGGPDAYTITQGQTLTADVVSNDYAVVGQQDPTRVDLPRACFVSLLGSEPWSWWTPPSHGTATITQDGVLTYVPEPGFVGVDKLRYLVLLGDERYAGSPGMAVCQGAGCTSVEVTITVEAAPPVVTAVPTLAPVALGALGALLGVLGMRRRRRRD